MARLAVPLRLGPSRGPRTGRSRYRRTMSFVIFGVLIGFVVYAMGHFVHEWLEARRRRGQSDPDDG